MAVVGESVCADPRALSDLGDPVAFTAAVRPHLTTMVRLAARLAPQGTPDDVVQEALIRAWKYRRRYEASKGSLLSWLLAIVANEARRATTKRRFRLQSPPDVGKPALPADDRLDVARAVQALPSRQRLAINCHYFVGLSTRETAHAMNCTEGTVKSILADARSNLRHLLGEQP